MSSIALARPSTAIRIPLKRPGARTRTFFASAPWGKQRLVILGSGWGGYEVLRAVDRKRWSKSVLTSLRPPSRLWQTSRTRLGVPWRSSRAPNANAALCYGRCDHRFSEQLLQLHPASRQLCRRYSRVSRCHRTGQCFVSKPIPGSLLMTSFNASRFGGTPPKW